MVLLAVVAVAVVDLFLDALAVPAKEFSFALVGWSVGRSVTSPTTATTTTMSTPTFVDTNGVGQDFKVATTNEEVTAGERERERERETRKNKEIEG